MREALLFGRGEAWLLAGLTILALLFRLALLPLRETLGGDEAIYVLMAQEFLRGNWAPQWLFDQYPQYPIFTPLYPLLSAAFALLSGDPEYGARMVSLLAGTLLVPLSYVLGRQLYDRRTGLIAASLTVVWPRFVEFATLDLTEPLYTLIMGTSLALGLASFNVHKGARFSFFTGLAIGLAYLAKPEGAGFLLPLLGLYLAFPRIRSQFLGRATVALSGFLVMSTPYILYLHQGTGEWIISGKVSTNLYVGEPGTGAWTFYSLSEDGTRIKPVPPAGLFAKLADPPRFVVNFLRSLHDQQQVLVQLIPLPLLLLVPLAWFLSPWSKERLARESLVAGCILFFLLVYAYFNAFFRQVMPVTILFLPWMARGLVEGQRWLNETLEQLPRSSELWGRVRATVRHSFLVVALLFLAPQGVFFHLQGLPDQEVERKEAGRWLGAHAPEGSTFVARDGTDMLIYSRREDLAIVQLPYADVERTLRYARANHAKYLVVSEWDLRYGEYSRPQVAALLDEQKAPPGLRLVFRSEPRPGHKILVYELAED